MSNIEILDEVSLPCEIIFSCQICQATISDIYGYPGRDDLEQATNKTPGVKLWLTECAHVTCSKHLPGEGVPFHRSEDHPRAVCPVCAAEKNDHQLKVVYDIRGHSPGTYNSDIPKHWFDTPPVKLDGSGKGMEALRFHYLSLVKFGVNMLAANRESQKLLSRHKATENELKTRCQDLAVQLENTKLRVEELKTSEDELRPWKERESKIRHYLGVFTDVTKENEKLREQLGAMGYAVPRRKYSFEPEMETKKGPSQPTNDRSELSRSPIRDKPTVTPNTASSRTLSGPRADDVELEQQFLAERNRSSRPSRNSDQARELMPPPPLPRQSSSAAKFSPFRQPTLLPAIQTSETRNPNSGQAGFLDNSYAERDDGSFERANATPLQHKTSRNRPSELLDHTQASGPVTSSWPISDRKRRSTDRVSEKQEFRYHDPRSSSWSTTNAMNYNEGRPRNSLDKPVQLSSKRPFSQAESVTSPFFKRTAYSRSTATEPRVPQNNGLHRALFSQPQIERHDHTDVSQEPWLNLRSSQREAGPLYQPNFSHDKINSVRRSDNPFTGPGGHAQTTMPYEQYNDSQDRLGIRPNLFSRPIATPIPSTPSVHSNFTNPQYAKQGKGTIRNQLRTSHKSGILWPSQQLVHEQGMSADFNPRVFDHGNQQAFAHRPRRSVRR